MNDLARWAEERAIRFIRFAWVDNGGVLRAEAVSTHNAQSVLEEGLPIAEAIQAVAPSGDIATDAGLDSVGQAWLTPDVETVRTLPWQAHHASVMGNFLDRDGSPWAHCPRGALERNLVRLREHGFDLQAAFEHEFMLLRRGPDGSLQHLEESHYASAHGLDQAGDILDAMATALEDQGVPVRTVVKEAGLSQFEFSTQHGSASEAADRFVIVRETIAAMASREGLLGTCLPLVFEPEAGNGWHLHFSLWRGAENLTGSGQALGDEAASFVAGIFEHLPGLLALTTPSPNSFRRIRPGAWCGAFRAWGFDHKEVPLRVPTERHGAPTNVELKASDASANPYLSLAGIIAAGLDGIERKLKLPEPVDQDPAQLSEQERQQRRIDPLPGSLEEALGHFQNDPVLTAALGEPLAISYQAVKRSEVEATRGLSVTDEVQRLVDVY